MNKTLILNRLKDFKDFKTDIELAGFLEISKSTLSNWYSRNSIDYDLLFSKCEQDININWLLTGEGAAIKETDKIHILNQNRKTTDGLMGRQEVPLYDLEATAGLQELFNSGAPHRVLDTIKIPNLPKCDGAITVTGDSMYPLLKSGDTVLYKQTNVDSIFFGEMYLLSVAQDDWEEYITVKYIQKSEKGDDWVKLVSQNQHHQPKDIKIDTIRALALIKASIRINTMM